MKHLLTLLAALMLAPTLRGAGTTEADNDTKTLRVFIFAGQSNMVGSDSKVKDIKRFPPFAGLDKPQDNVLFSYNIGREEKLTSKRWVGLQPVDDVEHHLAVVDLDRVVLQFAAGRVAAPAP